LSGETQGCLCLRVVGGRLFFVRRAGYILLFCFSGFVAIVFRFCFFMGEDFFFPFFSAESGFDPPRGPRPLSSSEDLINLLVIPVCLWVTASH